MISLLRQSSILPGSASEEWTITDCNWIKYLSSELTTLPHLANSRLFLWNELVLLAAFCTLGALTMEVWRGRLHWCSWAETLVWVIEPLKTISSISSHEGADTALSALPQRTAATTKRSRYSSNRFISDTNINKMNANPPSGTSLNNFLTNHMSPNWQNHRAAIQ